MQVDGAVLGKAFLDKGLCQIERLVKAAPWVIQPLALCSLRDGHTLQGKAKFGYDDNTHIDQQSDCQV